MTELILTLFLLSDRACAGKAEEQVASVAGIAVTEQDITDWQSAQACYGPDAITSRKAGFMRMYEAATLEAVLKKAGKPLSRREYENETARIDRETRAPEILLCIKKYFGTSGASRYERVFIRPILVQRDIREFVKSDPKVQAKACAARAAISKDILEGKSFAAIGAARGAAYSTATYALAEGTAAASPAEPWNRWNPYEAAFINEHLKGLSPGQVNPAPIEDEVSIRFVRLTGKDGVKYTFESLTIPKISTEDYLWTVPKLPVRINDKELREWTGQIKGNPLIAPAGLKARGIKD